MAVVVALFLFFIGFATLVLLHFLMMTNAFRRRRIRINNFIFSDAAAITSAAVTTTANLLELQDLLLKVEYSASALSKTTDCAIFLESFIEGDDCKILPSCQHLFHVNCVNQWLERKPNCPTCRTRVDLDLAKLGSRIGAADWWKMRWEVEFEEGNSN